jgi:hypothetical protein
MKRFVFASALALASIGLFSPHPLRAQDQSSSITIKDPAEYNEYQMAVTQSDPKAKAAALEAFLTKYPQTVVKQLVLDQLVDLYQSLDAEKELSADTRLLQVDPNNLKAMLYYVIIKKQQGSKNPPDVQTLDDAATEARKGLAATKPASMADDEWKRLTGAAFPIFHSAIATDDVAKKDFKSAVDEYKQELMLYPPDATKTAGPGLVDTLNLAEAYVNINPSKPDPNDLKQAIWFYSRAWDYAPAAYKTAIEKKLDYWYSKYHGDTTGLSDIKTQAEATLFPPGTLDIAPAKTPAEKIHDLLANTPDLKTLALSDKETILAYGSKDDADKVWAVLKDQQTPVPGLVVDANANQIKMAVSDDAKNAKPKTADFIVNMKDPIKDKDIPAAGFEFKLQPAEELDGTYDSYTQIPATDTTSASVQIVLRDGFIQPAKKTPPHKPAAGHRPAAH